MKLIILLFIAGYLSGIIGLSVSKVIITFAVLLLIFKGMAAVTKRHDPPY